MIITCIRIISPTAVPIHSFFPFFFSGHCKDLWLHFFSLFSFIFHNIEWQLMNKNQWYSWISSDSLLFTFQLFSSTLFALLLVFFSFNFMFVLFRYLFTRFEAIAPNSERWRRRSILFIVIIFPFLFWFQIHTFV